MSAGNISVGERNTDHLDLNSVDLGSSRTYGLVIVGLGPKGLSVATAMADRNQDKDILILERAAKFDDKLGFASVNSAIGSSFLQDFITHRNPRSEFTFINYLHSNGLLLDFLNISQMAPSRLQMGKYMAWVAEKIEQLGWIMFETEAIGIRPARFSARGLVQGWAVDSRNVQTGHVCTVHTKRLVLATGASVQMTESLSSPELSRFVVKSNECGPLIKTITEKSQPLDIAIIGADQEAAEVFGVLQSILGQHRATMFLQSSSLRPDDNVPCAPDIGPSHLPPDLRQRVKTSSKFPLIDLETLEKLYTLLYSQLIEEPNKTLHRFQLRPNVELVRTQQEQGKVRLVVKDMKTGSIELPSQSFHVIISSTTRSSIRAEALLRNLRLILASNHLTVDRDYKVNFRNGNVASDCGIWVLGSLVGSNFRRDDFNILSEMAGRIFESFRQKGLETNRSEDEFHELAML